MTADTDRSATLGYQLGKWAAEDPAMQQVGQQIAGHIAATMPAMLTDDQEISFLASVVVDLIGTIGRIADRAASEQGDAT